MTHGYFPVYNIKKMEVGSFPMTILLLTKITKLLLFPPITCGFGSCSNMFGLNDSPELEYDESCTISSFSFIFV